MECLLPAVQPAFPAVDQDDHRAADLRDAGGRDRGRRSLQDRRAHGAARDHLLRDRHDAGADHRTGGGEHHAPRRRRQPADGPGVGNHRQGADLGPDPASRRPRVGHRRDGEGRRAADRRVQHLLRHRAGDDRREGPAGPRLVRSGCRNDVQVHEHRHALRADRRRRGDRLHGRARRSRHPDQPRQAGADALRRAGRSDSAACSCRSH